MIEARNLVKRYGSIMAVNDLGQALISGHAPHAAMEYGQLLPEASDDQ
jgi:hypothetical protein